jgi:FtsP/CotA-like multicopper oxidase with cupredoxin domain
MKKLQNLFWILLPFALVGYLIYKIAMNSFTDHFLGSNPQHIKAIIIDDKNFMPNQPVDPMFTYSYAFKISGKQYTGNSHDITLRIGDTVEVEYNKDHPNINKPLHPKD